MVGRGGAELYVAVGASQRVLEYHAQALRLKVPLNPSPIVLKRRSESILQILPLILQLIRIINSI